ncbi:MAG TPA: 2-phospho-L-lactate transferase [Dehalococcoidia bacterium]|nr:2-phospho-L-lactate transferase [Dehalococcoidia bacterium]
MSAQRPGAVVLCGGIGGSRFLRALTAVIEPARITAIINTADDDEFHGLYVSPDPDIVTYALAGVVDEERGWGFRDESFRWLDSMRRFAHETWFSIGDNDLATHLHRTRLLREGQPLSAVVADIARAFGVVARLLPMSDDRVRTIVRTDAGDLPFQRYLVERHARDAVRGVTFAGVEAARPAPGVLEALHDARAIFIAPSNPIASIGPILAVPGVRDALAAATVRRVAVSPMIGGRSLGPPAAEMLAGLGHRVDAVGVAAVYAGLADAFVIDTSDAHLAPEIEALGIEPIVAPALLRDEASRRELAAAAVRGAGIG